MEASVDEIASGIYRISTCIPEAAPGGFTFNQFVIDAEEPLLYHTGMRALFPLVKDAVERVLPLDRLRWIAFAHVEADESGAVNEFLSVAPHAQVVHGEFGVMLSLNDLCDRPPRGLADGEVLDIGGAQLQRRMVEVATPHVPHNWESHMFYEQVTGTLFCGDLCTQVGDGPAVTSDDILPAAVPPRNCSGRPRSVPPWDRRTVGSPTSHHPRSRSCTDRRTPGTAPVCCVHSPTCTTRWRRAPTSRHSHCRRTMRPWAEPILGKCRYSTVIPHVIAPVAATCG